MFNPPWVFTFYNVTALNLVFYQEHLLLMTKPVFIRCFTWFHNKYNIVQWHTHTFPRKQRNKEQGTFNSNLRQGHLKKYQSAKGSKKQGIYLEAQGSPKSLKTEENMEQNVFIHQI